MSNISAITLHRIALALIEAINGFDVERALTLFTSDAVIDDPSTGQYFEGHAGIRNYIEQYFIGYQTVTQFLSMQETGESIGRIRVDFTGDFGHEIGLLEIAVNSHGLITRIDADLE